MDRASLNRSLKRFRTLGSVSRPLVLVAVLLCGALGVIAGPGSDPASAHTALLTSSPGSGQRVGGEVDFLDLVFLEPVSEVVITVTGPDRELIAGEMVVDEGQIIRFSMDPLTMPGRYIVRYNMISADDDSTSSGYFFEYEPAAAAPVRLGELDVPPTPFFSVQRVAIGVVGASMIGLLGLQVVSLRRKRVLLAGRRTDTPPPPTT